jgi:hypothetical protein
VLKVVNNLNYQTILVKTDDPLGEFLSISKSKINNSFKIEVSDVQTKLLPKTQPNLQPTFVDILYLQLKTI